MKSIIDHLASWKDALQQEKQLMVKVWQQLDQLQEMNNGHTDESLAQLYEELCQTHDKQAMLFRKYSKETLDLLQSFIKAKYGQTCCNSILA